jgi:hypothetical protein
VSFPFQILTVLSRREEDYTGGEFLLMTQRPRAQSIGEAINLEQGEMLIFPNKHRPIEGKRGHYRVNVRHGVSPLRSGGRYASASYSTTPSDGAPNEVRLGAPGRLPAPGAPTSPASSGWH